MSQEIDIKEYNALKYIVSELVYIARCQGWKFPDTEATRGIINLCYTEVKKSTYDKSE